jgi:streptomycin 6-kinase
MVTADSGRVDVSSLQKMFREPEVARRIFNLFATRQKNSSATKTDRILSLLYDLHGSTDRREVIQFFRSLEDAGCGEYVEGRRGHPSRFVWSVQMNTVGLAAAGKQTRVQEIADEGDDDEAGDTADDVNHPFRLRPSKTVTLSLPTDLTAQEAQRLADFIKTLPLSA